MYGFSGVAVAPFVILLRKHDIRWRVECEIYVNKSERIIRTIEDSSSEIWRFFHAFY